MGALMILSVSHLAQRRSRRLDERLHGVDRELRLVHDFEFDFDGYGTTYAVFV